MNTLYILTFILILISLTLILLLARNRKKTLPVNLYFDALRKENMGEFEQAEKGYQAALAEVDKYRFHDDLRLKIQEKIRLMHTVLEYQQNISFATFNDPIQAK